MKMMIRKYLYLLYSGGCCCVIAFCMVAFLPNPTLAAPCEGYTVILTRIGSSKVQTIKAVRELTGLGLRDSKNLVESVPVALRKDLSKAEALQWETRLDEAGAGVRLECSTGDSVLPSPPPLPDPPTPRDSVPPQVAVETDTILVKTVGDRIVVRAVAEDNDKVASITVYAQGRAVKTCRAWECWYGEEVRAPGPRSYHAVASDRAGNQGVSASLEFMVHPTSKPGPSLTIRTDPFTPTTRDRVRFVAHARHSSGVHDITLHVGGAAVRTCPGDKCEYSGGPYPAGILVWRVSARSKDGGETYGSENRLSIAAVPHSGACTIAGRAIGPRADTAPVFFVNLFGPDRLDLYRQTQRFGHDGRYRFDRLPEGRYRLTVDTRADTAVGAFPREQTVVCQGNGPHNVHFSFR